MTTNLAPAHRVTHAPGAARRVSAVLVLLIATVASLLTRAAAYADGTSLQAVPVAIANTPDDQGYWIAGHDGSIADFGDAGFYGSLPSMGVHVSNIVGITPTPTGHGYWLVGSDGGVFALGDAVFYDSLPRRGIVVSNIVGITATPTGHGYWLAGADGGVFALGDAVFYGSMGGSPLNAPVVGITATPTGHGYWLTAADGGVFSYGDAAFHGGMAGSPLNAPIVGITSTPTGLGYWLAGADGGVFAFGDAVFYGSMGGSPLNGPVVGITATHTGRGYWMVGTDGGVYAYGDAPFAGRPSVPGAPPPPGPRATIVQRATSEYTLGFKEFKSNNCNPYSAFWNRGATGCSAGRRSEAWCADFAAYVWQQAGANTTGITAASNSFQTVATAHGTWKSRTSGYLPQPGDAVVFGDTHVGVVVAVSSATSIEMISGNYSDAVSATWFNPATFTVSGTPVSGYAQPTM